MSRVVNVNGPGKKRTLHTRAAASLLRSLSERQSVDATARDMAAAIVYSLRAIHETVLQTIVAWEKRDYWRKADSFMREWEWANLIAGELEEAILKERWADLPLVMAKLMPHLIDVRPGKTRHSPLAWQGAYRRLITERSESANGSAAS